VGVVAEHDGEESLGAFFSPMSRLATFVAERVAFKVVIILLSVTSLFVSEYWPLVRR
jgi:hypothetical protein